MDLFSYAKLSATMNIEEANVWKERVRNSAVGLRIILDEGYRRRVWETLGYADWTSCIRSLADEFQISERHLWYLHVANKTESLLNQGSVGEIPERQLRPLARLEPEEQKKVWQNITERAELGEKITARIVQEEVDDFIDREDEISHGCHDCKYLQADGDIWWCSKLERQTSIEFTICNMSSWVAENAPEKNVHVTNNSGNNEWYTPPEYIEAARRVMGVIDLDPASSETANKIVRASVYFSADDNGLQYSWDGHVWMNPPYSSELIGKFCEKLSIHYSYGEVTEAIILVNNATETAWFTELIEKASAVIFTKGRVKFIDMQGNRTGAPLQGQAIIYLGVNKDLFLNEFIQFGWGAEIWKK